MNKLILLMGFCAFLGCTSTKKNVATSPNRLTIKQQVSVTWKGEIPCADCEGITYTLNLKEDNSFYETSVYKGKSVNPFSDNGTWQMNTDGKIMLSSGNNSKRYFLYNGQYLEMLDNNGKLITTQNKEAYRLHKTTGEEFANISIEKNQPGIDFSASGNEPFWYIEIDFENNMRFKEMNGFELIVPSVKGVKAQDANVTRYRSESPQGTLIVQIIKQPCTNTMNDQKNDYMVQVSVKKNSDKDFRNFSGCGKFTGDYRANDIWALIRIGNKKIDAKDLTNGSPTLELQLSEGKAAGMGGCNRYFGNLSFDKDKITFGPLASSKMSCPNINLENQYLNLISDKTLSYQITEGVLFLGEGQNMLVFKKVD